MIKKISLLVLGLSISLVTYSQDSKHRISLITDMDVEYLVQNQEFGFFGMQYQYALTSKQNVSGYIAFKNNGSLLGADYMYDFPILGSTLEFNVGGGVGYYHYESRTAKYRDLYLAGNLGFTYNFSVKPISVFAAYKPKVDSAFDPFGPADIFIGIGYRF